MAQDYRRYIVNVEAFVWHRGRYLMIVRGPTEVIAPNTLTPPGGKVECDAGVEEALEETLRREVMEETSVEVDDISYVESHTFAGLGEVVIDIVMLARYRTGIPRAQDQAEVSGIEWLTFDEIMADSRTMEWTKASLRRAEAVRMEGGW